MGGSWRTFARGVGAVFDLTGTAALDGKRRRITEAELLAAELSEGRERPLSRSALTLIFSVAILVFTVSVHIIAYSIIVQFQVTQLPAIFIMLAAFIASLIYALRHLAWMRRRAIAAEIKILAPTGRDEVLRQAGLLTGNVQDARKSALGSPAGVNESDTESGGAENA
ncbi:MULTISPECIES: hypothetical protein [unclassified Streptomyces]|uniref:hypothetical protein n=1 Tax=unclassified Streptomyces TaxID=2593676 RepID=UPI0033A1391E